MISTGSYKLILGSKSPRRQELLKLLGYDFEIRINDTPEIYSEGLSQQQIAMHLSEQKAIALQEELTNNEILLTADTIVCVDELILGKPTNRTHAIEMLNCLSGRSHEVVTGICIANKTRRIKDFCQSTVFVRQLSACEIEHYVDTYQPYDKAGSYGLQEWFGAIAVTKIIGSYNNVLGLPTHLVAQHLSELLTGNG